MDQAPSKTIFFVGLSGPASAGKTNMAHLLSHIFPSVTLILHADELCKEIKDLPTVNGYLDADGPDGVNFPRMVQVLDFVKANDGRTPPDFKIWQDDVYPGQDRIALGLVPAQVLADLATKVRSSDINLENT